MLTVPVRIFDRIIDAMNLFGAGLIAALVVLISADVLMRNLFNAPLIGVPELVSLSILAIVMLQLPNAVRGGRLTRSDALMDMVPARARTSVYRLFDAVSLLVIIAIAYFSWPLLVHAYRDNLFVGALGTFTAPIWPVRATLVFSVVILALQFLRQVVSPDATEGTRP